MGLKKIAVNTLTVFIIILCVYQFLMLSADVITGKGQGSSLIIKPRYGFMRVTTGENSLGCNGEERLAADFAQIYFPSRFNIKTIDSYAEQTTADPWLRPSRYPPLLHKICSLTLAKIPYGWASFSHLFIQLILLCYILWLSCKTYKITKYFRKILILSFVIIFLTPSGLAWFERGQFSTYLAVGYALLLVGIHTKKSIFFVSSAIFCFIKWTSIAFLFPFFLFLILSEFRNKFLNKNHDLSLIYNLILFLITFISYFILFYSEGIAFLRDALIQEDSFTPTPMSIYSGNLKDVPKFIIPITLSIIAFLVLIRKNNVYPAYAPLVLIFVIYSTLHPTLSYDYSSPVYIGLLPFLIFSSLHLNEKIRFSESSKYKISYVIVYMVIVFCLSYTRVIEYLMHYRIREGIKIILFESTIINIHLLLIMFLFLMTFSDRRVLDKQAVQG